VVCYKENGKILTIELTEKTRVANCAKKCCCFITLQLLGYVFFIAAPVGAHAIGLFGGISLGNAI